MVDVITNLNRSGHHIAIDSMHVDRKRVFVDRLKWNVPVVDRQYEVDQFDTDDAVYLVVPDRETQQHLGSVRLLPSVGPHLIGDVFPQLCERGVPRGDDIWEITRMCTTPALNKTIESTRVLQQLAIGCMEYGLLIGLTRFTLVTHMPFMPLLLSFAWKCTPLGVPHEVDGDLLVGLAIDVDAAGLARLRKAWGLRMPVIRIDDRALPAQVPLPLAA